MASTTCIVWFRRDLRLADHVALERAATASDRIVCVFVLDPKLLRGPRIGAPIACFFFDAVAELRAALRERGSDLAILEGDAAEQLAALAERTGATALYYNIDYTPGAVARDARVRTELERAGVAVHASLDHVYFGADEIRKSDGNPYTVFTPYKRRWLERHASEPRPPVASVRAAAKKLAPRATIGETLPDPQPETYGHARAALYPRGGERLGRELLDAFVANSLAAYADRRNDPGLDATSHLSPHLRAGTIGIRRALFAALEARDATVGSRPTGYDTWISELVWRDFYQQILANFPHVASEPFVAAAKRLTFRESDDDFAAWSQARTGYPIVDAAMTQLVTYGWMHNRLRMIVASFFTKDLLLDYRLGERFFALHLADSELAANNGGWQWSASTGTDAAPYFRVFNPILQSKKFDPDGAFIRAMLPALAKLPGDAIHEPWTLSPLEAEALEFRLGRDYPERIVDHAMARERALALYAPVMGKVKS